MKNWKRKFFGGNDAEPSRSEEAVVPSPVDETQPGELTSALTLGRVEDRLLLSGYSVSRNRNENTDHNFLTGSWDSFPFVIEIPEEYPGWILISADQPEAISSGQREELSASVNDWNRDKFFPTVAISELRDGPHVRAVYLMDLSMGVTDSQLSMHLDTALSSCVQALQNVVPVLPEF